MSKPVFIITLRDNMVPEQAASFNRLRMVLKKLLRANGFECTDIKQVIDESVSRPQSASGNDGQRQN